jgi:hypothetical protein
LNKPPLELDVVLIHNNNHERVTAMRSVLDTLKINSSKAGIRIHFADQVHWQPNVLTSLLFDRVNWALANSRTQYLFSRAKLKAAPFSLLRSSLAGTMSFCAYFVQEIRDAIGKRQFSSKHRQVSRKHSVAWKQFLTSSSDWLLVLEDDALFTKVGPEGLWGILRKAGGWPPNTPSFILVSEGLDLGVLGLKSQDFSAVSSELRSPRFPFANTAAAYLINRSLAAHFVKTLQEKPGLAYNTIDFLLNNLMLRLFLKSGGSEILCHHSTFPPFQNASINGMYSSLLST